MAVYEIGGKEVIYLSFEIEADSPEEAIKMAHEHWTQGLFHEGDTELQDLEIQGEITSGANGNA